MIEAFCSKCMSLFYFQDRLSYVRAQKCCWDGVYISKRKLFATIKRHKQALGLVKSVQRK